MLLTYALSMIPIIDFSPVISFWIGYLLRICKYEAGAFSSAKIFLFWVIKQFSMSWTPEQRTLLATLQFIKLTTVGVSTSNKPDSWFFLLALLQFKFFRRNLMFLVYHIESIILDPQYSRSYLPNPDIRVNYFSIMKFKLLFNLLLYRFCWTSSKNKEKNTSIVDG